MIDVLSNGTMEKAWSRKIQKHKPREMRSDRPDAGLPGKGRLQADPLRKNRMENAGHPIQCRAETEVRRTASDEPLDRCLGNRVRRLSVNRKPRRPANHENDVLSPIRIHFLFEAVNDCEQNTHKIEAEEGAAVFSSGILPPATSVFARK